MAKHFQLDLKTLEVSSQAFDLSLSVTSVAFIYDVPLQDITCEILSSLIQSKQLWLLPRGLCRMDMRVHLSECDIGGDDQAGFLEYIADAICQFSLWSKLGLGVKILDIQYLQEEHYVPNLFFSIEQSDMSCALLSPPYAHTAHIKGLECILRFESPSSLGAFTTHEKRAAAQGAMITTIEAPAGCHTRHTSDALNLWENAAWLVEAALCITFGTRKRIQGLNIIEPGQAPSLLDLAPATWNYHYLKSTLNHTKKFAVISNILASSLKGQSPELRRKGARLIINNVADGNSNPEQELDESTRQLESSIQRKLWGLLQDTLESTMGTRRKARKLDSLEVELEYEEYGIDGAMINEGAVGGCDLPDESHYSYGDLLQRADGVYDEYGSNANFNLETEMAWPQNHDSAPPSDDSRLLDEPGFWGEVESLYHKAGASTEQLSESYSQQTEPDLCCIIQDHAMSDYDCYERDIYGYEHDYTGYVGWEPSDHEFAALPGDWDGRE